MGSFIQGIFDNLLKKKRSRLWNNLRCHGFHKKENITNSMIIFYVWMIFAQVKLFHSSGLMWNSALTKHYCQSAQGPPIGSHGSISTVSNHGSVYSGYSIHCTFAAPHQHNEKQRQSFVFVGSREDVSQLGPEWRHDCQSPCQVAVLSFNKPHTGMFLNKGSSVLQLQYF